MNRIHKFTSHTFHVLIRELIHGAKSDKSNLFTMIKEHRNHYMIRARETRNLAPYNAKNTLDFIQDKFVKNNENATHIAWTKILLHTRLIGQAILPVASFFRSSHQKIRASSKQEDATKAS